MSQLKRQAGGKISIAAQWRVMFFIGMCAQLGCVRSAPAHRDEAVIEMAITVDDLPQHGPLPPGMTSLDVAKHMLDVFSAHHVSSVHGFVNGVKVEKDPSSLEVLKAWKAVRHPLGNHSWSHVSLNASSFDAYWADVERNEQFLNPLELDSQSRHYFRYPYLFEGDTLEKRHQVRGALQKNGYRIAHVTIDANDWAFNPPFVRCLARNDRKMLAELRSEFVAVHLQELEAMRSLTRRLVGREIKHVLLLHLGVADADALDELLTAFERRGVRWVSLSQALTDPFYEIDPDLPMRGGAALPYRVALARKSELDGGIPTPIYARDLESRLQTTCSESLKHQSD